MDLIAIWRINLDSDFLSGRIWLELETAIQEREFREKLHTEQVLNSLRTLENDTYELTDFTETRNGTFDWVWTPPIAPVRGWWNSFPEFLKSGGGCYWINVEPGVGKVYLMSYIAYHHTTQELLRMWAGAAKLLTASFTAHAANGRVLSLKSILKSLLFQVFSMAPDLLLTIIPAKDCETPSRHLELWSLDRLKKAFSAVISETSDAYKIVVFVDGLHKFSSTEIEQSKILDILSAPDSARVKIILSSRSDTLFAARFRSVPQLLVEEMPELDWMSEATRIPMVPYERIPYPGLVRQPKSPR